MHMYMHMYMLCMHMHMCTCAMHLLQHFALWLDVKEYVVVNKHIDNPIAEPSSRNRDLLHERVVELRVRTLGPAGEFAHLCFVLEQQVVLVEVKEVLPRDFSFGCNAPACML